MANNSLMDLGRLDQWCQDAAGSNQACEKISDFSGFVYHATSHRMLFFGGGHATTFVDYVMRFNPDTLTFSQDYDATPCSMMKQFNLDEATAGWKAGPSGPYPRPVSRHTYDLIMAPAGDYMWLMVPPNGSGDCISTTSNLNNLGKVWRYHLPSKSWKTMKSTPTAHPENTFDYPGGEVDPISGKFIMVHRGGMHVYDPATDTKFKAHGKSQKTGIEGRLVFHPPSGDMFMFSGTNSGSSTVKVWRVVLDRNDFSKSTITQLATSGSAPPSGARIYSYDTKNQVFGGAFYNNKFHWFDPATNTWNSQSMAGGPAGNSAYHSGDYDPVNNVYVFKSRAPEHRVWVYRFKK